VRVWVLEQRSLPIENEHGQAGTFGLELSLPTFIYSQLLLQV
jgi:hypothetical protein